jgi:hypothetical protein
LSDSAVLPGCGKVWYGHSHTFAMSAVVNDSCQNINNMIMLCY